MLETKRQEALFVQKQDPEVSERLKATAALGLIGVGRGLTNVAQTVLHPVKFVTDTFEALRPKNFVTTIKGQVQELSVDPVGVVAEFYVFGKIFNIAGRGIKKSSVGRYVQEEFYIRYQSAKIAKNTNIPISVVSPIIRAIIKGAKVQEKINPFKLKNIKNVDFFSVKTLNKIEAQALKKTLLETDSVVFGSAGQYILSRGRTPIPKDVDLATVSIREFNTKFLKNIPEKSRVNYVVAGQKIYKKVKTKAQVVDTAGAKSVRGGFLDPILDVKPIERLIPNPNFLTGRGGLPVSGYVKKIKGVEKFEAITKLSKDILKIKKDIVKAQIAGKSIKKFSSKLNELQGKLKLEMKKFKPADIPKVVDRLSTVALEVPTQKIVSVGGIKIVGFGEQTTRKALGTLSVIIEKNIRRAKDPQSFVNNLQVQLSALKRARPKTKISRVLNRRKIKKLSDALKILTSPAFVRLLEKNVKGINQQYPIIGKIDVVKLRKVKKNKVFDLLKNKVVNLKKRLKILEGKKFKTVKDRNDIVKLKIEINRGIADLSLEKQYKKIAEKLKIKTVKDYSVLKKRSVRPSRLPKLRLTRPSRLPKFKAEVSKLASKVPKKKPSEVPKFSRIPRKRPSVVRVGTPSKLVGKKITPSKLKVVKERPSVVPRISKRPSKLRKARPSKLRLIRRVKIPPSKIIKQEIDRVVKREVGRAKNTRSLIYIPDLVSTLYGLKAKKLTEKQKLLLKGRIFSGLERRPIV